MPASFEEAVSRSGRPSRADLIETTVELLRTVGPQAVQARRIAAQLGVSTTVVYRRFGGMPQLVAAVVEAGFGHLAAVFDAVPEQDDPIAGFCALALEYRTQARANPHLFDLMFGLSNPGGYRAGPWTPAPVDTVRCQPDHVARAYEPLVRYATRAVDRGVLRAGDPEAIAAQLWSFSHGFVVLELAGHLAQFADPLREVFGPMGTNLVVGLGADSEKAAAVMSSALGALRGVVRAEPEHGPPS